MLTKVEKKTAKNHHRQTAVVHISFIFLFLFFRFAATAIHDDYYIVFGFSFLLLLFCCCCCFFLSSTLQQKTEHQLMILARTIRIVNKIKTNIKIHRCTFVDRNNFWFCRFFSFSVVDKPQIVYI